MIKKTGKITIAILLLLTAIVIFLQWWIINRPHEIILFENGENLVYTLEKESGYLMPKSKMKPALQLIRQTKNTLMVRVGILKKTYLKDEHDVFVHLSDIKEAPYDRKKIAILYISTGRYIKFWNGFYNAMERYFLPNHDKTYFLFTDHDFLPVKKNVVKIHQDQLEWPYVTLKRFHFFDRISEQLKEFDYIYFLNGTMLPVAEVTEDIFPTKEQEYMVTLHPGYMRASANRLPYDRNRKSKAFIPSQEGKYYVMGGFNGGTSEGFLKVIKTLKAWTDTDLENGVIPVWHDESMLNRYVADTLMSNATKPLILLPEYAIPEQILKGDYMHLKELFEYIKMYILEKSNYGGHDFLRGISNKELPTKHPKGN